LWLVRRGKNLEQNPRWTALNCLCAERIYRGWVGIFRPDRARYSASVFVSKKRSPAKPLAAKKKIIVPVTFHIPGPLREFTGGLTSPVPPGSDIFIVPAISGGCGSALTIF